MSLAPWRLLRRGRGAVENALDLPNEPFVIEIQEISAGTSPEFVTKRTVNNEGSQTYC
jgi:hypothetical protein